MDLRDFESSLVEPILWRRWSDEVRKVEFPSPYLKEFDSTPFKIFEFKYEEDELAVNHAVAVVNLSPVRVRERFF